ncbi:MAG: GNAT family N-acetyltransferase [Erysipelotrichaceae bacterium]|nr:GNAT family N-acetyltransferase [Erysipelotrichaceae bacterium]
MIIIERQELSEKEKGEVWQILIESDREFVPPLSARSSTVQQDLQDTNEKELPSAYFAALQEQSFLLAKEGEETLGFLSYRQGYVLEKLGKEAYTYVSTVIVRKPYRGQGITAQLYQHLRKITEEKVLLRTWSGNTAHMAVLTKLGFREVLRIPNDRGEGIDTVYYCFGGERSPLQ